MKCLSLFTGVGGFDLALERSGHEIVAQSENDSHCVNLLRSHFDAKQLGNIETLDGVQFKGIELICGGFPCQNISKAGDRKGLDGEKSKLWYEFSRGINEALPQWVLIENVSGLLSSNGGRDSGTVLGALVEMGYGFAYRVLDAQWFGVPQRRRRIFIVGYLGNPRCAAEVLFEPEGGNWYYKESKKSRENIAGTLEARTTGGGYPGTDEAIANHVVPILYNPTRTYAKGGGIDDIFKEDSTSHALHVTFGAGNKAPIVTHKLGARRLMPIECERLQGFPDNWTAGFSDTTRYRMLGNAVAVPVVEWIVRRFPC